MGYNVSRWIGAALIPLGLLLNRAMLEWMVVPDGHIDSAFARVAILACEAALIAVGLYLVIRRPRISMAQVSLAISSTISALLVSAGLTQIFYDPPPPIVSGWRSDASKFELNALRFRGQPIVYSPDDFVIVLLGDSMVQARACAFRWMPERRLESHLNAFGEHVRVFTLGAEGYGQDQQLLALREYYEMYRADLVVLYQVPSNDIWNNVFPTHGVPKPTFRLDGDALIGPSEQIGQQLPAPQVRLLALVRQAFDPPHRDTEWEKYLPAPYAPLTNYSGPVLNDWQTLWDSNHDIFRQENFATEKNHEAIFLTPRSPRMQYGLNLTRRLLTEIEDTVVSHGGSLVIFRPDHRSLHHFSEHGVHLLNGEYYRTSEQQAEANLNYMNQDFPTMVVPVTVANPIVGPEDPHLNQHAVDQVMHDLASRLLKFVQHTERN